MSIGITRSLEDLLLCWVGIYLLGQALKEPILVLTLCLSPHDSPGSRRDTYHSTRVRAESFDADKRSFLRSTYVNEMTIYAQKGDEPKIVTARLIAESSRKKSASFSNG